ncbi:uncharacterized protein LOC115218575 [Argonauta hians]
MFFKHRIWLVSVVRMAARRRFQVPSLEDMETNNEKPLPVLSTFQKSATRLPVKPATEIFSPTKHSTPQRKTTSSEKKEQDFSKSDHTTTTTTTINTTTTTAANIITTTKTTTASVTAAETTLTSTKSSSNCDISPRKAALFSNQLSKQKTDGPLTSATNSAQTVAPSKTYTNSIIVNSRQRGNPILKGIRNVPWEFGNIVPDYEMGKACCALFLSLRYHQLHPEYIHKRLESLGKSYDLRVMLVQVDVKDCSYLLKDLGKMCILANCTLILAFSPEEAGRYLETYKVYENKPPDAIMEKTDKDYFSVLTDCLTTVKQINKTDCTNIISKFMSLEAVIQSDQKDFTFCPGLGPRKAGQLYNVFHEPFLKRKNSAAVSEEAIGSSPKK